MGALAKWVSSDQGRQFKDESFNENQLLIKATYLQLDAASLPHMYEKSGSAEGTILTETWLTRENKIGLFL